MDRKPIVAVLDLNGTGVSQAELEVVTNLLVSSVFDTGLVEVIDRNKRKEILSEIEFSVQDCTDEKCAIEIGKMLAADIMVFGLLSGVGKNTVIDLKAVDVGTTKVIGTYYKLYDSLAAVLSSIESIGVKFVQDFTGGVALRKQVFEYESLVPLAVLCDQEGAGVWVNGASIGRIKDGKATKTVNRDSTVSVTVSKSGYYDYTTTIAMDDPKSIRAQLDPVVYRFFSVEGLFGSGMMGSIHATVFVIPNWWFAQVGLGATVSMLDPLLVNGTLSIRSGTYIGFDDHSLVRPFAGAFAFMPVSKNLTLNGVFDWYWGPLGGVEFKILQVLRISLEVSANLYGITFNVLYNPETLFSRILQIGIGINVL